MGKTYDAGLQDGWYEGYRQGLKEAGVKMEDKPAIAGNANRARQNPPKKDATPLVSPDPSTPEGALQWALRYAHEGDTEHAAFQAMRAIEMMNGRSMHDDFISLLKWAGKQVDSLPTEDRTQESEALSDHIFRLKVKYGLVVSDVH